MEGKEKTLSIIIPVYNEEKTILELLALVEKVDLQGMKKEIIIVDDCSTDGTKKILQKLTGKYKILFQEKNEGKGLAVRLGFLLSTGDFIIVQDADLEYDPEEYINLLQPLISNKADVVYGSRFMGNQPHRVLYFWHYLGNKFLTIFSNVFTNLNLSDMETCYKVFNRLALEKIKGRLTSNRFGIEPEITALVARSGLKIYEIGISYHGRTYQEGKKINWRDGFSAIWSIVKFNLIRRN